MYWFHRITQVKKIVDRVSGGCRAVRNRAAPCGTTHHRGCFGRHLADTPVLADRPDVLGLDGHLVESGGTGEGHCTADHVQVHLLGRVSHCHENMHSA